MDLLIFHWKAKGFIAITCMKCASHPIVIVGTNFHYLWLCMLFTKSVLLQKVMSQGEPTPTLAPSCFSEAH
jgi:hypothetical protein